MLLDLNKLHGQREHVERTLKPSAVGDPDPDYPSSRLLSLRWTCQGRRGRFRGDRPGKDAVGAGLQPLPRALRDLPVDAPFELRYVPDAHGRGRARNGRSRTDDLTTAFYRDGLLDIGELLREQFQLALPMKPLCSDACRGLCALCGTNLNRSECDCKPEWEDPRLAPLKSLLTDRRRIEMPNPKRRHSKTRTAKRRTHDALKPVPVRRLPAVPGSQTAAPGLLALWLLCGPAGPASRRSLEPSHRSQPTAPSKICRSRSKNGPVRLLAADG